MAVVNPIKDIKKIEAIKKILQNNKRDLMLFIFGINSSLRISDILKLNIGDVIDSKGLVESPRSGSVGDHQRWKVRKAITIYEKKTGKAKQFPLNDSITDTLKGWIGESKNSDEHFFDKDGKPSCSPLFISSHGKRLSYSQAWRIISQAGEAVGLEHIGTHSLRKTFGYHVYKKTSGNLGLVQKLLNHDSSGDTIKYIGIDQEQMDDVYLKLNL